MNKPLSLLLPEIEAVWAYDPLHFTKLKQALDGMDYSLALQFPRSPQGAKAASRDKTPSAMWDDEDDAPAKPYKVENGIAILNLCGPMTKQYSWLSYYYGGTSTQQHRALIRLAVADPDVTAILQIVYSGGGQVAGTQDLAQDIAWASKQKPFLSLIEDLGCSAAYWAASQSGAGVYVNNASATGGSVGTIMGVDDTSKANMQAGVTTYILSSGDRKGIGADGTEITPEQRAYLQAYIDSVNVAFLGSVQTARKLSDAQLKDVSRAGLYVGQALVAIGLVDGIATLEECKALLQAKVAKQQIATNSTSARIALTGAAFAPILDIESASAASIQPAADKAESSARPAALITTPAATSPATTVPDRDTTVPDRDKPASANALLSAVMLRAGGEGKPMKEKLVRVLSALGLHKMAVAIVASTDDSPETLAQTMSEQVGAEVKDRIQNHPLMLACAGAGINDVSALERVLELKALGERHLSELRDDARAQCVRAHGPELGAKIGVQVDKMGAHEVKVMRDAWQTQADATFKLGENGAAAKRETAPAAVALNAEEGSETKSVAAWDQLTPAQQDFAKVAGHAKTTETREAFAVQYLRDTAKPKGK